MNLGADAVRWLMVKLRDRGIWLINESDPSPGDRGWYVTFGYAKRKYDVVVSYAPAGTISRWLLRIERRVGLVATILGKRTRGVDPAVVELIDKILRASPEVRKVRWHRFQDVRRGDLEQGAFTP
jgi:hypothetical protein